MFGNRQYGFRHVRLSTEPVFEITDVDYSTVVEYSSDFYYARLSTCSVFESTVAAAGEGVLVIVLSLLHTSASYLDKRLYDGSGYSRGATWVLRLCWLYTFRVV